MPVKSSYGGGWTNVTGTWTDTALAYDASTTTYAYISVASGGSCAGAITTYGFGAGQANEIPAGTLLPNGSVMVDVWFYVSNAARWSSVTVRAYDNTTPLGNAVDLSSFISTNTANHANVSLDGITSDNLRSSNFNVRITGVRTGTSSSTFYLKQAGVTVTYSTKLMWTGSQWKSFVVWNGSAWTANGQVWTGSAWV